jgi:hypothetical protein
MSAYTATLRGRVAAEKLQVDTCTIRRVASVSTDPETGVVTPTYTTVYSGQCRLKLSVATARPADVGQAQVFMQHPILSLPATTSGVQVDDVVTITASALMPALVGRVFHVRGLAGSSHMTAARFEVMEVMG